MTYDEWEASVSEKIRSDTLWRVQAYRLGLFLSDLTWADCDKLLKNPRTIKIADQLFRASGNISATIAEGYSRDTGKARATYYEYAVGSARECRDWYHKARRVFSAATLEHRLEVCTSIIKLGLRMIATERRSNRRSSS